VEGLPLLWAALLAVAAVAGVEGNVVFSLLLAAPAVAGMAAGFQPKVAAASLAIAATAAGLHAGRKGSQDRALREVAAAGRLSAAVEARVISEPRGTGGGWGSLAEIEKGGPEKGGRVWWRGAGPAPGKGARIAAEGRFLPLPDRRNPGEFDVAQWLYRQGSFAVFEARGLARQVEAPSALDRAEARARAWFRQAVTAGMDPAGRESAVVRAMVLGDMPDDDDVLVEAYRNSGTLHVFSVSGMHVAMVGAIVWGLLRLLRVPRSYATVVILLAMFGYAWLTGLKAPATRAVLMAMVVLGAFVVRRRPSLLNALGAALLMAVLLDGHQVFQVGVQLSFGVVAAIGFGTAWMTRRFAIIERREPYLPLSLYGPWRSAWLSARQKTAAAMGASSAASLGSLPLTLWHFGFISWISVIASPLIGMPVFLLMTLALLAAVLSPLPAAQQAVNRANSRVAALCTRMAEGFAAVPLGHATLPRDRPGKNFLVVHDTGHGGGAACLHDGGSSVIFDAGHRPAFRRTYLPSLRHLALRPRSMVLSHPDGGHLGGAAEALDAFPVRQILLPVERARSTAYRDVTTAAAGRGVATARGIRGTRYPVSPTAWLEVLHEPDPWNWHAVADERVMITRLHWHGWRILFTADAGLTTERALLEGGAEIAADVIVAGRNRHDGSLGDDFLAAVRPRAIIASHADHPPEERVPPRWRAACERKGIEIFHQGESGAVTLVVDEKGGLTLRGFVDGRELRLDR
jgi:ComEC/Rec2-related protein